MTSRRRLIRLALAAAVMLLGRAAAQQPRVIRFLQVGQGDAVLVTTPDGQTLLYDGGSRRSGCSGRS